MGDQPDDGFGRRRRQALAGLLTTMSQPIQPDPTAGIDHHLDDVRILKRIPDETAKAITKGVG